MDLISTLASTVGIDKTQAQALAGSVLGNLFGQGTPLRLPIQIRGTWAAPEILLDSEGLSVRELLKRNADAATEARGMPIPQATEE